MSEPEGNFPSNDSHFPIKHGDFPIKNGVFPITRGYLKNLQRIRKNSAALATWCSEMAILFMRATKPQAVWRHGKKLAKGFSETSLSTLETPASGIFLAFSGWNQDRTQRSVVSNWLAVALHQAIWSLTRLKQIVCHSKNNRWKPEEIHQEISRNSHETHWSPATPSKNFSKNHHRTLSQGDSVGSPHGRVASGSPKMASKRHHNLRVFHRIPETPETYQRLPRNHGLVIYTCLGPSTSRVIWRGGLGSLRLIVFLSYNPHCRSRIPIIYL